MAEESHIRRNKGRFIKKTDPLKKSLSISSFNLMEICDTPITYADNIHSNVIHHKLHTLEALDEGVRQSIEIETSFEPAEFRPVIKPLDFTQEWIKQKKRQHNRNARADDEDEIDVEMENIARKLRKKFSSKVKMQEKNSEANETRKIGDRLAFEEHIDDDFIETSRVDLPRSEELINLKEPMEDVADSVAESPHDIQASMDTLQQAVSNMADPIQELPSLKVNRTEPMSSNIIKKDEVKEAKLEDTPLNPVEEENVYQKARSDGFEQGYRDGEEKAMLAVNEKVNAVVGELKSIFEEFTSLKSNILHSAQDNFQMICQTLVESLIQREFLLNPESFENVIQKAISEAVPNDEFKVLVSQDTYTQIKDFVSDHLASKLKVDQELKGDNFKIESQLSVVDGNISQIIKDLLDQADLDLFAKQNSQAS